MGLPEREQDLVETLREGLTLLGYDVFRVGQRRSDLGGQDSGCPDLLVTSTRYPIGVFLGLEVKTFKGRLSPRQAELAAQGRIVVVRSWEAVLRAIEDFEEALAIVGGEDAEEHKHGHHHN
jgi:hypothetical protein